MMDYQTTFDKIAAHLFKQGRRAIAEGTDSTCVYFGPHGRRCAAGALIPDEFQDMIMNTGMNMRRVFSFENADRKRYFGIETSEDLSFIMSLQDVHDHEANWKDAERMREALEQIAKRYDLDTSNIPESFGEKAKEVA